MPIALLKAYAAMLPRLEAEEQLARVEAGVLAFGGGDKAERREAIRELQRRARGPGRRAKPAKASLADLAGMGIAVRIEGQTDNG
ncbi:MAG: hypothetical protein ACK4IS_07340 [Erythrobacter sp.]